MQAHILVVAIFWACVGAFAAELAILNKQFLITQGDPFTLRYTGCENKCSIDLLDADSSEVVEAITNNATGDSCTLVLDFILQGMYVFRLAQVGNTGSSGYFVLSPKFGLNGPAPGATRTAQISDVAPIPTQRLNSSGRLGGMGTGAVAVLLIGVAALL